jgi:hypothetical protein
LTVVIVSLLFQEDEDSESTSNQKKDSESLQKAIKKATVSSRWSDAS